MSEKPISDLRRRMLDDMAVRQFGEKTRGDYIRHVETFTRFLGRSPDTATAEDVRRFQVHLTEMYGPTVRCKRFVVELADLVLHQCIRPQGGAFVLPAIMDFSAHPIS